MIRKQNFTFIIFLCIFTLGKAQVDPNTLLSVSSLSTSDIVATTNASEGSLVFDSDKKKLYQFDGTNWKEVLTSPTTISPKTASYTLVETDNYSVITFNSTTDVTLTVPTGLSVGFNVSVYQVGSGSVTITGTGGVTLKNRLLRFKTAGLDAGAGIVCTSTDIFHITGDLKK